MDTCVSTINAALSAFQNQSLLWTSPDVAGWLDKRGGSFASWKTRFFILQSSSLFYFASNNNIENAQPLGVVPLEGSSLEVADQQHGFVHRKWCIVVKLGPQFETLPTKRSSYFLAAPSKQALEEWLDKLATAGSTHAKLLGQLNQSRRMGCELRSKLLNSSINAKMLLEASSSEAKALQMEIKKVKDQLVDTHEQALASNTIASKHEGGAMRYLAYWSVLSHHISGSGENNAHQIKERLAKELEVTKELCSLLQTKANFLRGCGLETLDEDGRTALNFMCGNALDNILEQQAKIRVKAPRYTNEVDPIIFLENDTRFMHTSKAYDLCLKFKISSQKRIVDLKVKAATEEETAGQLGGVISKLGIMRTMAIRAGKAAAFGLQHRLAKSKTKTKALGGVVLSKIGKGGSKPIGKSGKKILKKDSSDESDESE